MVSITPKKLSGNWFEGYFLDYHTISSVFLGYDEFGHQVYDTKRSEIGELLYRLKYQSDKNVINDIINTVIDFIVYKWKISNILDAIIPMPPSRIFRKFQPVLEITRGISSKLNIDLLENSLKKVGDTPELKSIYDYQERLRILNDAFVVDYGSINVKNILLFDDLYRSGATLYAATNALYTKSCITRIYALVLTKTRTRR